MPPRKGGTSVHARKNIYFLSGFVCKGFSAWKGGKTAVPGAGKNERLLGYKNFQPAEMPGSKHFFGPVRTDGSGGEVFRGVADSNR